jgi:hypothetical protein
MLYINNSRVGTWQIDKNSSSATFTIPKALLEESFRDETRLVTLMLRLKRDAPTYGLQIERMQIRPFSNIE